ncbi:guanylate kinase [Lentisphaera profundi]|uniref:Guanylate kinase n=1 Tax=Lentisphaera profundi TaxID=1658616 RepID=A0ABY7VYD7_9BACT|nr:guanylate kinase [Lentisphaera profundi]WDE99107.1 guanylate kinase [Lentisphaera profundi]
MSKGVAIIMSGPSGAGKSTVCHILLENDKNLSFSVSCTTRQPRAGEQNGVDYHFLSREEFEQRIALGDLLEYAEVHGNYYGTLKSEVLNQVKQGKSVLIDIDVQGQRLIRGACVDDSELAFASVFVFFAPPSYKELESRLRGRGTEDDESLSKRLNNAKLELEAWNEYDYMVINHEPVQAASEFQAIIQAEKVKVSRVDLEEAWPHV